MDFKIRKTYSVQPTYEFSVDCSNGYNFLIIYGHHINGWFIAIPNWGFCTEAAEPEDVLYNTERMMNADKDAIRDVASSLASAIKMHYEVVREKHTKLKEYEEFGRLNEVFSTEAAEPEDVLYNAERMMNADKDAIRDAASSLASAIKIAYNHDLTKNIL